MPYNTPIPSIVTSSIGRGSELKYGPGNNQYARASDVNPIIDYLDARAGINAVSTSQTGTTSTINALAGSATFTTQSIAAGSTATYTITNSNVSTNSIINVTVTAATAGAVPIVTKVVSSAGSFAVTVLNFTGATTYTSISFSFLIF